MSCTTSYSFRVPGAPTGKGRPRFVRQTGRTYTPHATEVAENRVLLAWAAVGASRIDDAPVELSVVAVFERPKSHYLPGGGLNAAGIRQPWPTKAPDVDNVVKLVCDALNGHAYRDDAQVVFCEVAKRWAEAGEGEGLDITVRERQRLRSVA